MNCNLPKITYPTLRTLLLVKIYEAICRKSDVQVANRAIDDPNSEPNPPDFELFRQKHVLKQVKNQTSVAVYQSSITLQLGAKSTQTRKDIAYQVAQFFQTSPFNPSEGDIEKILLRDLTVSASEAGQLRFEFGDLAIAHWLQMVLRNSPLVRDSNSAFRLSGELSENSQIFFCQYSYARCAAILRLINPSDHTDQTVEIGAVLWLRNGNLLLNQERSLVAQIVRTLDEWEDGTALKSAIALSQAFQTFYQTCQIVKYDEIDRSIAQCRLALVMITHWLLRQLLEQGLSVLAPETL
ncbi:MAG: hypothetical protein KME10_03220 [Plectolyngbya sp. WJT66-NPBG17]|nr:hypothetical protein [Plectolyngbya sp. WJT66-NPBG17]